MGMVGKKLYVTDGKEIVVIDTTKGSVDTKISIEGALYLNDIAIGKKGIVYVSDTKTGKIHRLIANKSEVWLENIPNANGLKAVGSDMYILSGTRLIKVNKGKKITTLAEGFEQSGDGVECLDNGDFIVSCWWGLIYYVSADGTIQLLLNTGGPPFNTADIAVDTKNNILYVPTYNHKSIMAFKIQ